MDQAHEVQFAATATAEESLAKQYGVKGIPILSCLSSLFFPLSFPYDFMHLIYENVIKNLVLLWTGTYKGLGQGTGSYQLSPTVWDAIGAATAAGGDTIPTAFGARPPDVSKDRTACTADTWSFWLLFLGPVLLHNKFQRPIYYKHFIEFVKLIHLCLQFEYSSGDIALIRTGFANWVEEYERYISDALLLAPFNYIRQALLSIRTRQALCLPPDDPCSSTYRRWDCCCWASLGLLGIPHGTLLRSTAALHQKSTISLCEYRWSCGIHRPALSYQG
jgi:hypothetical protein